MVVWIAYGTSPYGDCRVEVFASEEAAETWIKTADDFFSWEVDPREIGVDSRAK